MVSTMKGVQIFHDSPVLYSGQALADMCRLLEYPDELPVMSLSFKLAHCKEIKLDLRTNTAVYL